MGPVIDTPMLCTSNTGPPPSQTPKAHPVPAEGPLLSAKQAAKTLFPTCSHLIHILRGASGHPGLGVQLDTRQLRDNVLCERGQWSAFDIKAFCKGTGPLPSRGGSQECDDCGPWTSEPQPGSVRSLSDNRTVANPPPPHAPGAVLVRVGSPGSLTR